MDFQMVAIGVVEVYRLTITTFYRTFYIGELFLQPGHDRFELFRADPEREVLVPVFTELFDGLVHVKFRGFKQGEVRVAGEHHAVPQPCAEPVGNREAHDLGIKLLCPVKIPDVQGNVMNSADRHVI